MYKCKKCGKSSEPREPRQVIIEYKKDVTSLQIQQEIPVCSKCKVKEEGTKE